MNMNKNKIIFAIIWVLLVIWIILVAINLKNSWNKDNWTKTSWEFKIWMVGNNTEWANVVIENFKKVNPEYSSQAIKVENFSNYDDYSYALISSIIAGSAPDLFVLNNNEKNSIFSNQVKWIESWIINPNDFRKKYKWVFSDDLIVSSWEWEEKQEFLVWLPVWYETLGIFYNRRYVKDSELTSLSTLNTVIAELKKKKPSLIPIWIWNWSTVFDASDIITQFFLLEKDISSLEDVAWTKLKQALSSYLFYWDESWYNGFDSRFMELSNLWQNSIDLFSKGETFMVVWYPSLINEIEKKWFSKNFLLASPFPHYYSWDWKTLVNYNYFVINKDSDKVELANVFLWYLSSDIWADDYLKQFPYYLPALLSLESDKLEEKIHENYNIILDNFFNPDYDLSSFDKWIKSIYDSNIISILDNSANYESAFNKFKSTILCKTAKIVTLENLSTSCE